MSDLTPKQKAFIEELPKNQWNGTKVAIAAGYSAKSAGVMAHRLLKNPKIADELGRRTAEIVTKTDVEVGEIIAALCTIAFGGRVTNSDRLRALDLLGRYKGIFSEKRIIETVDRHRELTDAEKEEAQRLAVLRFKTPDKAGQKVTLWGLAESQNPPSRLQLEQHCVPPKCKWILRICYTHQGQTIHCTSIEHV